ELKGRLVQSHAERTRRIESGEITIVGVNDFTTTEPSPLEAADEGAILVVDPAVEAQIVEALEDWRAGRDAVAVADALARLQDAAAGTENVMEATIALAEAGGTVGEWAGACREVFGEWRAPTGVSGGVSPEAEAMSAVRETVRAIT